MNAIKGTSPEYYEGDTELPIFSRLSMERKRLFTVKDIVMCLLHPSLNKKYLCQKVPIHITKNVSFLIDTDKLGDARDLDCDDMGVWKNNRVDKVNVTLSANSETNVGICKKKMSKGVFTVKRIYRSHGTDPSLKKITATIFGMYCLTKANSRTSAKSVSPFINVKRAWTHIIMLLK